MRHERSATGRSNGEILRAGVRVALGRGFERQAREDEFMREMDEADRVVDQTLRDIQHEIDMDRLQDEQGNGTI